MKYRLLLISAAAVLALGGCNNNGGMDPAKRHEAMVARMDSLRSDLLNTDIAFSQMSEQKGRNAAFIAYAADNATFLRPYSMPVTGKDTIINLLKQHSDTSLILTWIPIRAQVARSGDLGFTYGTYSLDLKSLGKEEGTYCTVWRKDKNKEWKFVLDTGNEGLKSGEKEENKEIDTKRKADQTKKHK